MNIKKISLPVLAVLFASSMALAQKSNFVQGFSTEEASQISNKGDNPERDEPANRFNREEEDEQNGAMEEEHEDHRSKNKHNDHFETENADEKHKDH